MNSETCEKLSVLCLAAFGLATEVLNPAAVVFGGAGAILAVPAIMRILRRTDGHAALVSEVRQDIERNWRAWANATGELSEQQIGAATAALGSVLDLLDPDPEKLMKLGRINDALSDFLIDDAVQRDGEEFAPRRPGTGAKKALDPAQAAINTQFLRSMLLGTMRRLDGDPNVEAYLAKAFQVEVFERLSKIETQGDAIAATLTESFAELKAMVAALGQPQRTEALKAGISPDVIIELARRIRVDIDDPTQALTELGNAVDIAVRLSAEGQRGTNTGDFVDEVLARMAAFTRAGDFEAASKAADEALARWERHEEDRREVARQSGLKLLSAGIEADLLRRDATSVARRAVRMVDIQVDAEESFETLRSIQDEWYARGRDKGLNVDMLVSIELARVSIERATNADQRGRALNDLALSLSVLGQRERSTERLEEAVAAYRLALNERPRGRVPLDWAMTQNNLGNALSTLGSRERGSARLLEAVDAYRLSLAENTRERVPLEWAMTQNNLGNALAELGRRESGTARLEEAVAAFRLSLGEYKRKLVPLEWAMTQNNLGNTLAALGERESGTVRLNEAVDAFRFALEEYTRERVPLDWATTQNNLGNALSTLGEREGGTARIEEAVAAYRLALEERMRERVPLDWAMTQNNLGTSLSTLGERETGTARIEEAVAAYRLALEERTRERVPLDWAMTQNNLGVALSTLGERESDPRRLDEAINAYRLALMELTPERLPYQWARVQESLAVALLDMLFRTGHRSLLVEARTAVVGALEVYQKAQAIGSVERMVKLLDAIDRA